MARKTYKRPRKRKPFYRYKLFWITFIASKLFGALVFLVVFSPFVQAKEVAVQGANQELAKAVQAYVENALARQFGPWHTTSLALFAPGTAEQDILSSFPLVGEVDVRRTFKRTVEVVLRERKEIAVWCSAQSVCFSMDKEGVVFEKKDPAAKDFVIYDYIEKSSVALGQKALEGELLSFAVLFKNSIESSRILREEGVEFHSLSLLSDTRIHWKSSQGWQAYTNPKGDASWQFTKLEAVIDKKISSAQRGNLDYIELRFGDQAYIKYRE